MNRILTVVLLIAAVVTVSFSASLTIKVSDGKVPVEDATVVITELSTNMLTSDKGIVFIGNMPSGSFTIIAVMPGYEKYSNVIEMKGEDRVIPVRLLQVSYSLGEITVESKRNKGKVTTQTTVKKEELEASSQFIMNDAIKTLQMMPGVSSSGSMFDSRMYIQGGDFDEWIGSMDGVYIMNPYRWGGRISMFNPYILESIDLYTAGYPAEYGQGLSGVVAVETKNGNKDRLKGFFDISSGSSEISLEGPLSSNFTVFFDIRRTYYELIFPLIYTRDQLVGIQVPYLWDGILKLNWDITYYDSLSFDMYGSLEGMKWNLDSSINGSSQQPGEFEYQSVNLIGSARYKHRFESGDSFDFTAGVLPQYEEDRLSGSPLVTFDENQTNYLYQLRADYFLNSIKGHKIQAGGMFIYAVPSASETVNYYSLNANGQWTNGTVNETFNTIHIAYYSAYLLDNWEIFPSFIFEAGAREEYFTLDNENAINPQAGIKWETTDRLDFFLRGGLYHLFPMDVTLVDSNLGNPDLKSDKVYHLIGGSEYSSGDYIFRIEGFYKYYFDMIEGDSVLHYNNNGVRNVYGGDIYLQKKARKGEWLSGWIAYTYTYGVEDITARSAEDPANPYSIPSSEWFIPNYLRSHTISAIAEMTYYKNPGLTNFFDFMNEWKLSIELTAMSGKPYTPVTNFIQSSFNGGTYYYFDNGKYDSEYTPWYVRLDVKLTIPWNADFLKGILGPNVTAYAYIQVLNVLDLPNIIDYSYTVQNGQLVKVPVGDLPIIPLGGVRIDF